MNWQNAPTWFLVFMVTVLMGYVAWSLPRHYNALKELIDKLGQLTEKLFEKFDDHEQRLSRLQGEHEGYKSIHDRRVHEK